MSGKKRYPFNRTFMELKPRLAYAVYIPHSAFNRTFMELKQMFGMPFRELSYDF